MNRTPRRRALTIHISILCASLAAGAASSETRVFSGAGAADHPNDALLSEWTRPAVGVLAPEPAFWESTSFFVSESGAYAFTHEVDLFLEPQPVPFPRVLLLYAQEFDSQTPDRNLMAILDISDGGPTKTTTWPLIANNTYHLVLSTVDEIRPTGAFGALLPTRTRITGPGRIGRSPCRFTDDLGSDADNDISRLEGALAQDEILGEQICALVSFWTPDGVRHEANVARQRTIDSVLYTFFDEGNWEVNLKLLDGCAINGRYWLFASASTDLPFEIALSWLGHDAAPNPANPNWEPFFPQDPLSLLGQLVYRSPGGPATGIVDTDAVLCSFRDP